MAKKIPTWEESTPVKSPSIPISTKDPKAPTWEESTEIPEDIGMLEQAANVIDIPASLLRTGVEAAISPEREIIPSVTEQFKKTIESPTSAAMKAPTGVDINKALKEQQDILKPMRGDEPSPVLESVGGFVTEMILDPTNWFMPSKSVTKPVRKSLESASERQATKAISKYATRTDISKEGVDLPAIGARLVAEDLQGFIRNPTKLYEYLTGTKHVPKIAESLPETLRTRSVVKDSGKIKETSEEISNAISKIEKEYDIKPQIPMAIMYRELLNNAKKNISDVSGETVDLNKIESILKDALKPYREVEIPGKIVDVPPEVPVGYSDYLIKGDFQAIENMKKGGLEKPIKQPKSEIAKEPSKLTLSGLHQLRKNIGQQVADRAFYATSDMNIRQENIVLAELYRTLGDVIEKNLRGKSLTVGNNTMDAADYYRGQNDKLKSFMDIRSMLDYQPTKALQSPDLAATLASMVTKGGIYGATAAGASMAGLPYSPIGGAIVAGGFGAAQAASEAVKASTPEYLTSILKTAGKVQSTPMLPEAITRGTIQYMRQGQPVSEVGREPQSVGLTPKQLINYRIPRSTQGILENKEAVLAKLTQQGVPKEMVHTVAQAMNGEPDDLTNMASIMATQFPDLFEKSKYMIFDGKFLNPNDKARAADDISRRDDLDSIQRAKMISRINKTGEVPEGM